MKPEEHLISKIEEWLKKPVEKEVATALSISNELLEELQNALQQQQVPKEKAGPLLGKIRAVQKSLQAMRLMDWVSVRNGALAIGHRPGKQLIQDLKLQNTHAVLTLLSEKEGAKATAQQVQKHQMQWLWFSMESAQPVSEDRYEELFALFKEMEQLLSQGAKIYIHCSAGIHRTGMISLAFLRFLGLTEDEAWQKLTDLRLDTVEGVGAERKNWANQLSLDK